MLTCQAASCSILQVDPSEYYVNRYTQENLEAFDLDSYLPSNKSTLPEIQRIPELDFKIFRAVYIKIIKNHDKNVSGMGQMGMTYADIPRQSLAPDYPVFQKSWSEWNCFTGYLYFFFYRTLQDPVLSVIQEKDNYGVVKGQMIDILQCGRKPATGFGLALSAYIENFWRQKEKRNTNKSAAAAGKKQNNLREEEKLARQEYEKHCQERNNIDAKISSLKDQQKYPNVSDTSKGTNINAELQKKQRQRNKANKLVEAKQKKSMDSKAKKDTKESKEWQEDSSTWQLFYSWRQQT